MKEGFHSLELNHATWEVPQKYSNLGCIGFRNCSADDNSKRRFLRVDIEKISFFSAIHAKRTYRELRMLKHMDHENIIGLLDCFTPQVSLDEFTDV